jgi:tungstate transport system substrate-binding protein
MRLKASAIGAVLMVMAALAPSARADNPFITLQSTTSTENSGLLGYLLPIFTAKTGIDVHVVAVGSGQAIKNAQNGDGDVLLVHAKADEEKFVAEGWGVKRFDVMYNDFVIAGPSDDPAKIAGTSDPVAGLKAIAAAAVPFISRGDDSGTHKAELKLWKEAGIDVKTFSGTWYREAGQGMGATLNMAASTPAYVLTDRASWSAFKNKGTLAVVIEKDKRLHNPYGVILVNPEKHPNVKAKDGQAFVDWIISPEGQTAIAGFKIEGEQQFFPTAAASQ